MAEEHQESTATNGASERMPKIGTSLGTAAAVGIAVALIEKELVPGLLIGVGAMLAPQLLDNVGRALRPVVKGAVRAGYGFYTATREKVAEATEQIEDIVAEVKAEDAHARTSHDGQETHGQQTQGQQTRSEGGGSSASREQSESEHSGRRRERRGPSES